LVQDRRYGARQTGKRSKIMTRKTHTNLTNLDLKMLSGGMETMP